MVDLVHLRGPHEDAGLAGLLGQAVVDVGDDGESGALWVTEANVDPVIPETSQTEQNSTDFISQQMLFSHRANCYYYLHLSLIRNRAEQIS